MSSAIQCAWYALDLGPLEGVVKLTLDHPALHIRDSHNGRDSQRSNGRNSIVHSSI